MDTVSHHYAVPPVPSKAPAGMRWYWSTISAAWHLDPEPVR